MLFNYTENGDEATLTFIFLEDFRAPISIGRSHPLWSKLLELKNSGELSAMEESDLTELLSPGWSLVYANWMNLIGIDLESNVYGTYMNGVQVTTDISESLINLLGKDTEDTEHLFAVKTFLDSTKEVPDVLSLVKSGSLKIQKDGSLILFRSVKEHPDGYKGSKGDSLYLGGVVYSSEDRGLPLVMKRTASRPSNTVVMSALVRPEDILSAPTKAFVMVSKYTVIGFGDTVEFPQKNVEKEDVDIPSLVMEALERVKALV